MKLLVTGASGLLGLNFSIEALKTHSVIGVDRGRLKSPPFELRQVDLLAPLAVEQTLADITPDAVIHCAAMANVDACEHDPEAAWAVNANLPKRLAAACGERNMALVHISTDAVFDGTRSGAYTEDDPPKPHSVYAETKTAAERHVLSTNPRAIVARVNFYGWSLSGTRSVAEFFVNNLSAGRRVRGFTDVVFCPIYVADLSAVLLRMLETGLHGLFHAVGPEPMTKYEFGVRVAKQFGYDANLIEPDSVESAGLPAKRAHNLNLSVHKLSAALGNGMPEFSTGLHKLFTGYQEGYPQKVRSYQQPM